MQTVSVPGEDFICWANNNDVRNVASEWSAMTTTNDAAIETGAANKLCLPRIIRSADEPVISKDA